MEGSGVKKFVDDVQWSLSLSSRGKKWWPGGHAVEALLTGLRVGRGGKVACDLEV